VRPLTETKRSDLANDLALVIWRHAAALADVDPDMAW
jgi:hypothetical protein